METFYFEEYNFIYFTCLDTASNVIHLAFLYFDFLNLNLLCPFSTHPDCHWGICSLSSDCCTYVAHITELKEPEL